MSKSDPRDGHTARLIGFALVAVIGISAYWAMFYDMGFQSGQNDRKANVEAQHYASTTAMQVDRECGAVTGQAARECIAKIVASERESQRSESDLAAQWKAADWVMWAGILAGAQLIATGLGLFYVRETLTATLRAVEDTSEATAQMKRQNDMMEANQRPWLSVKIVSIGNVGWAEDGHFRVDYVLAVTNSGNMPAVVVGDTLCIEQEVGGKISKAAFIRDAYKILKTKAGAVAPGATETFGVKGLLVDPLGTTDDGRTPKGGMPMFLVGVAYQGPRPLTTHTTILEVFAGNGALVKGAPIIPRPPIHVMKTLMD